MSKHALLATALASAALMSAQRAQATPITFTETVIGSGTLDGEVFSDALVTFTGAADTTQVIGHSQISHLPIEVDVAGVGSDTFTDDFLVFANDVANTNIGFGDVTNNLALMYVAGPVNGYDLKSDFSLTGGVIKNLNADYATTGGDFSFSGTAEVATFRAELGSATPEPAAWALMITGFGLTGAMLRRRRGAGASKSSGSAFAERRSIG